MASPRVEDHLLVECAKWHGRTDALIATSEGFDPLAYFEAQLQALIAVGLLDEAEAAEWRRRFEDAGRPDEELRVDGAARERVERYLESLVPAQPSEAGVTDRLDSALDLLERIGVLSEDEVMRWFDRVLPPDEDDDEEDDFDEGEWRELRKVLLGPPEEAGGFRVTSLELYDDAVVVRWNGPPGAGLHSGDLDEEEPALALSDDVGTGYAMTGSGSGGGGTERSRGATSFVPSVPEDATRLVLEFAGGHHSYPLGP